jgi:hypothetical protein
MFLMDSRRERERERERKRERERDGFKAANKEITIKTDLVL